MTDNNKPHRKQPVIQVDESADSKVHRLNYSRNSRSDTDSDSGTSRKLVIAEEIYDEEEIDVENAVNTINPSGIIVQSLTNPVSETTTDPTNSDSESGQNRLIDETTATLADQSFSSPTKPAASNSNRAILDTADSDCDSCCSESSVEELVVMELQGVVQANLTHAELAKFKILGVHTDKPLLQIGKLFFQGKYDHTMGTEVIFQEDKRQQKPQTKNKSNTNPTGNSTHDNVSNIPDKSLDNATNNTDNASNMPDNTTSTSNNSTDTRNNAPNTNYNCHGVFTRPFSFDSSHYDPVFSRPPEKCLRYIDKTERIFRMQRVFVKKKIEEEQKENIKK